MTSETQATPGGFPQWAVRRAVWFLVAVHLPFVVFSALAAITRLPGLTAGKMVLIAAAAAAACGLQLRHSLAAARGGRPRGWPVTFAALILLTDLPYLTSVWYASDWVLSFHWFVLASALMLLPRRARALGAAVTSAVAVVPYAVHDYGIGFGLGQSILFGCYYTITLGVGGLALYGSARLVGILGDLFAARTELAEQALARERARVSRDLHDLLGQSLSAVSLKGDLAMRLLPVDPPAARREIESLTSVARSALHGMRAVTRAEHDVSLAAETDSAQAVLRAAGAEVHVAVALPGLPPALEAVLAWAVREGATNILRHSQAAAVAITASRADGRVRLEMVNDGAQPSASADAGSGLAGLAARARAIGGTAGGAFLDGGQFRLLVEIPEDAS
jgi:two-component system sensor histidine kinase DesK